METIQVIAVAQGYDGVTVRKPGEEFTQPANVFDKRPILFPAGHVNEGKEIPNRFYPAPSWFRKKTDHRERAVAARATASEARNKADGAPADKNLATLAEKAEAKAKSLEAIADKADEGGTDLA